METPYISFKIKTYQQSFKYLLKKNINLNPTKMDY